MLRRRSRRRRRRRPRLPRERIDAPHEVFINDRLWRYRAAEGFDQSLGFRARCVAAVAVDTDVDGQVELSTRRARRVQHRWNAPTMRQRFGGRDGNSTEQRRGGARGVRFRRRHRRVELLVRDRGTRMALVDAELRCDVRICHAPSRRDVAGGLHLLAILRPAGPEVVVLAGRARRRSSGERDRGAARSRCHHVARRQDRQGRRDALERLGRRGTRRRARSGRAVGAAARV